MTDTNINDILLSDIPKATIYFNKLLACKTL